MIQTQIKKPLKNKREKTHTHKVLRKEKKKLKNKITDQTPSMATPKNKAPMQQIPRNQRIVEVEERHRGQQVRDWVTKLFIFWNEKKLIFVILGLK